MAAVRGYRHPDGTFEVVTFVADTVTARAFYANAQEVTPASAQAALDAIEAARPITPTSLEKLLDTLEIKGVLTSAERGGIGRR